MRVVVIGGVATGRSAASRPFAPVDAPLLVAAAVAATALAAARA